MKPTESSTISKPNWRYIVLVAAVCIVAVYGRVVALGSDAFPGLSWSSALLTDEGFYIHNARNVVLFGVARTDEFNNMLIMPALHALQLLVFRIWGVGAVQARMIAVVASLLTLPLFYISVDRSLGRRTAITATVILALDHVYFLYNRLALMDSPATSLLIVMLYLWVLGLLNTGWRRIALLYGCGLSFVLAYAVRGLAAPICFAPFAAIWLNAIPKVSNRLAGRKRVTGLRQFMPQASPIALGLVTGIGIYLVAWYLPNHSELARLNRYYFHQLMPSSIIGCIKQSIGAVFGDARGMAAYLLRHSSTVFILALAWMVTRFGDTLRDESGTGDPRFSPECNEPTTSDSAITSYAGRCTLTLAAVWLAILWLLFAVAEYSPSRYYLLCYPAMAIVAAHALWDLPALVGAIGRRPVAAAFLLGLTAYHVTLVVAEHCFSPVSNGPVETAVIVLVVISGAVLLFRRARTSWVGAIRSRIPVITLAVIGTWAIIDLGWSGVWLAHLTYRQRDADNWLGTHLPENSVLFGAVAPGLCMNNHFRSVSVIEKLCNDREPLEQYNSEPQYVLILDDNWREPWWDKYYPGLLSRGRRIKAFPHVLRPAFVIGVYKVPEKAGPDYSRRPSAVGALLAAPAHHE